MTDESDYRSINVCKLDGAYIKFTYEFSYNILQKKKKN